MKPDIYTYDSARHYLKDLLQFKKQKNAALSLRSWADRMGLSSSALSSYLGGSSKLSTNNSFKVLTELDFDQGESEFFLMLVTLENLHDQKLREDLRGKISSLSQAHWPETQKQVLAIFDQLKVDREIRYAAGDKFRFLTLFKNRNTSSSVRHFSDRFYAVDWKTAGTGYFIENEDKSFRSYLERGFSRQSRLEFVSPINGNLNVEFDHLGFPTIYNFMFAFLHSDHLMQGTLKFSEEAVVIRGKKFPIGGSLAEATDYCGTYYRVHS